jgi:hypothetical protein
MTGPGNDRPGSKTGVIELKTRAFLGVVKDTVQLFIVKVG